MPYRDSYAKMLPIPGVLKVESALKNVYCVIELNSLYSSRTFEKCKPNQFFQFSSTINNFHCPFTYEIGKLRKYVSKEDNNSSRYVIRNVE